MDQATAQVHLDAWLAADTAISAGKAYTIGNRQLTRANAQEVRDQITFWRREVKAAAARASGIRNPNVTIASWNS